MKTGQGISKPILLFAVAAVALIGLLVWVASPWPNRTQPQTDAGSQTVAENTPAPTEISPDASPIIPAAVSLDGGLPPVIPISLASAFTKEENAAWFKDKSYLAMPRGTQNLGGIEFWIEGVIQLRSGAGKDNDVNFRSQVVIPLELPNVAGETTGMVQRGSNVAGLHLLGATRNKTENEVKTADLIWRYTDGTVSRSAVQYLNHVRDWNRMPFEGPAHLPYKFTKVVWKAKHPSQAGRSLRLYRVSYANPEPAKVVRQLEFISALAKPGLFFIGLTLDPVKLGGRPDNSPDLEEQDNDLPGVLDLFVQDANGQPVSGATVRLQTRQLLDGKMSPRAKSYTTDAHGSYPLRYPTEGLENLQVSVTHDNYGGRKIVWNPKSGDIIPASYTFKLDGGISIGGTVVDESEQPVAGVKLNFYRYWSGGEDMNRKGEQSDFSNKTATTDVKGVWSVKGVPPELLDRIGFGIKHPDFVETSINIGNNPAEEAKFRAGTHKIVLKRGLIVRGKVTDEYENPITGARVWAGKVNYGGAQDTKTDATGAFSFRNLKEEETQFSVLAKGRKPETKNATVKPGMAEIVFKLGPGSVIRGLVKNEAGEPVSGVRIALESPSGGVSHDFQFEMTSDKDGRFEWDGAPDEPRNFCFLKTGYESKRGQRLKLAEENIVTLRKGRKVEGLVVDAETGNPITKFRVGTGRSYDPDRFYADYPGMKDYSDANGAFTVELNEEQVNGIKAEADDYAEKVENLPAAESGIVKITLRLKPSAALRGVLVNSEGLPVAGATVALTKGDSFGGSIQLRNGRLSTHDRSSKVVTTDASGNFTLPSPPETGGIVVASAESGYASAPVESVRSSGRLVLQGFGRVEGTIKIGGVPTAGQEFMFSLANQGVSMDWESYKASSDESGRFSFNKVPAGEGAVVRLLRTAPNSWMHSHNTPVTVESGKTVQVTFGETGAVIKGQLRFETPPADQDKLTYSGSLRTVMRAEPKFQSPEESRAFYESSEWKEQMKQMKHFGVMIGADGAVTADSIPPGSYILDVSASKSASGPDAWRNPPVAHGSTTIVIPDSANPFAPIRLNDVLLKPVPQQPTTSQPVPVLR